MKNNRALRDDEGTPYDIVAGPMVIVGLSDEDFASLTPEQEQRYVEMYKVPERFEVRNGKLVVYQMDGKTFDEFRNEMVSTLHHRFTEERSDLETVIQPRKVEKTTGSYEGIDIAFSGSDVSMCVNLEPAYEEFKAGRDIQSLSDDLYESLSGNLDQLPKVSGKDLADYSWVQRHLGLEAVNTVKSADILKKVPYREVAGDVALIYRINLDNGNASTVITNQMLKAYGV